MIEVSIDDENTTNNIWHVRQVWRTVNMHLRPYEWAV